MRGQFHDSFEYYGAGMDAERCPDLFQRMHGYDIQSFAGELLGGKPTDPDTLARVKSDYRETLARLHLEYLDAWVTVVARARLHRPQPVARRSRQSPRSLR